MSVPQIIIDTNVLVAATRSRRGALLQLLRMVGLGYFGIHLSVPLVLEYEDVLSRQLDVLPITPSELESLIDFHCEVATCHDIFFLWRPFLPDPKDDMVLELAIKAQCDFIVTYNTRDFRGAEKFGIRIVTPNEVLKLIGASR